MQKLNWRIIHTHDTEAKWNEKTEFIPKAGELIVYDVDENYSYERFKVGDGVTPLVSLPFTVDKIIESIFNITNRTIYADAGRITDYEETVT